MWFDGRRVQQLSFEYICSVNIEANNCEESNYACVFVDICSKHWRICQHINLLRKCDSSVLLSGHIFAVARHYLTFYCKLMAKLCNWYDNNSGLLQVGCRGAGTWDDGNRCREVEANTDKSTLRRETMQFCEMRKLRKKAWAHNKNEK